MENFNRSIELGSSQIMGLYKELSKLDPDSRFVPDSPVLKDWEEISKSLTLFRD